MQRNSVTLTYKILSGLYLGNTMVYKDGTQSGHQLEAVDVTFDLAVVTLTYTILSRIYVGNH